MLKVGSWRQIAIRLSFLGEKPEGLIDLCKGQGQW